MILMKINPTEIKNPGHPRVSGGARRIFETSEKVRSSEGLPPTINSPRFPRFARADARIK
jgi:hypothetical protein